MIIAHDLGTSGNKASLHDDEGRLVAAVTVAYPTRFAPGGIAEQDPEDWWRAVGQATGQLLERCGVAAGQVHGMGLSGQMMGSVLLDRAYRPVRPAMIWADGRSQDQARALRERVGERAAYAALGHRVGPTYPLPKAMWVRDNEPAVWERVRHLCVAKDYVALRLTGTLVTDHSDASSTNAYDLDARAWSAPLLQAAGIDHEILPPVVDSTQVIGGLSRQAAEHTGLRPRTPVVVGGGDGPVGTLGAGICAPEDGAYVSLGSSAWVATSTARPLLDPQMRSFTFVHVVPGQYAPTATMQAGGASLQWVVDLLAPGSGPQEFGRLLQAAGTALAADTGLYFLPQLLGERSPYWNTAASGVFAGLGRHHGPPELVRAVLEGVAFNLRTCLQALTENGVPVDGLDVVGGGAGSDVWLQVLADVWGVPVRRRTIVEEANSLGAAVLTLAGLGRADLTVARTLSSVSTEFLPEARRHERYAEQHTIFRELYDSAEPWFDRRLTGMVPEDQ